LNLDLWDVAGAQTRVTLAAGLSPADRRSIEGLEPVRAVEFQLSFEAVVNEDLGLTERHTPLPAQSIGLNQSVGTPLLRAVNILERIVSIYDLYSLSELDAESSGFKVWDSPGTQIVRCVTHLDVPALLVHSENQQVPGGDPLGPDSRYEFVEISFTFPFERFEAKLDATERRRGFV